MSEKNIAKWQRELKSFLGIKSGIILEGNTLDKFVYENEKGICFIGLDELISNYGNEIGAEVVFYNPLQGFYCYQNGDDEEPFLIPYLEGYVCKKMEGYAPGNHNAYMPIDESDNSRIENVCFEKNNVKKDNNDNKSNMDFYNQVYMSRIILNAMTNSEIRYYKDSREIMEKRDYPSKIFVLNFASRMECCNLDKPAETEMFMNLHYAINNARISQQNKRKNMIIMVVDKYNDIPAWFYLNNPNIRSFYIEKPDRRTRRQYMSILMKEYKRYDVLSDLDEKSCEEFVAETEGLLCTEIKQLISLAMNEKLKSNDLKKAVKIYKYGIKESPWEDLEDDIIERLNANFNERVQGQEMALGKVKNVVMRSVKGLSGLQHSNANNKPRGVLFFAGPTGVGKTETAKTIAETIFGDEESCIRFDMSEYRNENSDQKLFGAPPGYIGYEGGGQLTNAVKNHPFSVLLFDEIEKAHPSIMDKFLQILEDGRMTDNQGNTVYFSESIIIFTSNIGLTETVRDDFGNEIGRIATIEIENPYLDDTNEFKENTRAVISEGVKNYFLNIGRPELLNRLGENNIVVFDFIDKSVATKICEHQINKIIRIIEDRMGINIDISEIMDYMQNEAIGQRSNGGRGIGNMLEEKFINPLAEFISEYCGTPQNIKCYESEGIILFRGV